MEKTLVNAVSLKNKEMNKHHLPSQKTNLKHLATRFLYINKKSNYIQMLLVLISETGTAKWADTKQPLQ